MLPSARTFFCLKVSGQKYLPWLSCQEDKYLSLLLYVSFFYEYTDKNNLDKSYKLVKQFLDFPLWEKRNAYFK